MPNKQNSLRDLLSRRLFGLFGPLRGLETRMLQPCLTKPDLFFVDAEVGKTRTGHITDPVRTGAAARLLCMTECPFVRECASRALEQRTTNYGVWAGVFLPGTDQRHKHRLARAKNFLRQIASGTMSPHQIPENAVLLRWPEKFVS